MYLSLLLICLFNERHHSTFDSKPKNVNEEAITFFVSVGCPQILCLNFKGFLLERIDVC